MIYYKNFIPYDILEVGKKKKYDNNIYTFDIETTSYIIYNDKVYNNTYYEDLDEKERKLAIKQSCMYIWMFGINKVVYYGRTWQELKEFLKMIDDYCPIKKIIFIHNLSFEFQFLWSVIKQENVFARKSRKVMTSELSNYNFELRCSYYMSNSSLDHLAQNYNLPVEKLVGNLDYSKIRHSKTKLTDKELAYCENDILVLYYYIKLELKTYEYVNKIPKTSTGHVRRELFELTLKNYSYKNKVRKSINIDPHIYNLLVYSFQGGYTHASYIWAGSILKNVDSYDEASAYPYHMVAYKYPSTEFKRCYIKNKDQMLKGFAYLMKVKFTNVKSKYYNHIISASKCIGLRGAKYDNGRIIEASEFEMIITDVDFYLYLDYYNLDYEFEEIYYSKYDYLPIDLIKFILDKYEDKTKYKGVEGMEEVYQIAKQNFNSIFGMSVTNMISDLVKFNKGIWEEIPLTNDEIIEKLKIEKGKAFLSFSYGVWITAWSRNSLLRRVKDLDPFVVYCDTDSIKLIQGYDKNIFREYNKSVLARLNEVSKRLNIDISKFAPVDKKGNKHPLGLFELETKEDHKYTYDKFITQGAKRYCCELDNKLYITVSGVPKKGSCSIKDIAEFKDGLIFKHKDTNKNLAVYNDNQVPCILTDEDGISLEVNDKSGICILPNTYTLGKSLDYATLLSDYSAKRSLFMEGN